MRSQLIGPVLVIALWLGLGCSDRLAPELSIDAHCNPCSIQAGGGPFVGSTIRNVSSHVIALASCGGTDIIPLRERLEGGEWTDAPLATCVASLQRFELAPGEVISTGFFNFSGVAGTYRFRAPLYGTSGQEVSREASPSITIR